MTDRNGQPEKLPRMRVSRDNSKAPDIVREGALIYVLAGLGKVSGFVREWVLAYFFGASIIVDAFRITFDLSNTISGLLSAAQVEYSLVPLLSKWRTLNIVHARNLLFRYLAVINVVLAILSAIALGFLAPWATDLIAPGYNAEQRDIVILLIRWVTPSIPIFVAVNLLGYLLVSSYKFRVFTLLPMFINPVMILSVLLVAIFDAPIQLLSLGFSVGLIAALLSLAFIARDSLREKYRSTRKRFITIIMPFVRNWWPLMLLGLMFQLRLLIDKRIISDLGVGAIAALGYARFLVISPLSMVGTSMIRMILPRFSDLAALGREKEMLKQLTTLIEVSLFVLLPIIIVIVTSASSIIQLIYGYGAFDADAAKITSAIIIGFAPLIWIMLIRSLINRVFNAQGRNVALIPIHGLGAIVIVIMAILFTRWYGAIGVAAAASIGEFLNIIVLLFVLERKIAFRSTWIILQWWLLTAGITLAIILLPHPDNYLLHIGTSVGYTLIGWSIIGLQFPSGRRSYSMLKNAVSRLIKKDNEADHTAS
ncbi:MAG: lipid II flippase MurJ [Candidatus Electryonea clarkiae]|nr:lipid II flippase MurJ [Candidatus Electryonea clarkiae]MDP8289317.1 lipid II flippase MurJ [Candidatus Electryonea clarkiae]